jgi:hypothetical protein
MTARIARAVVPETCIAGFGSRTRRWRRQAETDLDDERSLTLRAIIIQCCHVRQEVQGRGAEPKLSETIGKIAVP